jgi:uncharacterized membrane protein
VPPCPSSVVNVRIAQVADLPDSDLNLVAFTVVVVVVAAVVNVLVLVLVLVVAVVILDSYRVAHNRHLVSVPW